MRRRVGIIVPFDCAMDHEYWKWAPPAITLLLTRTPYVGGAVTLEMVSAVSDLDAVGDAVRRLVKVEPEAVAYACTSGSFVNGLAGETAIRKAILSHGAAVAVTTSGAMLEALGSLGARKVAVATPYAANIGEKLVDFLKEAGLQPVSLVNLSKESSADIYDLAAGELDLLAEAAFRPEADALFISCTNLESFSEIARLEARFSIPVLTANQVTMWALLRAAGIPSGITDQRLFTATPQRG